MSRPLPKFGPGPAGAPSALTLTLPLVRPWKPSSSGIGGTGVAVSGVKESFMMREDELCRVVLRCTIAEWPYVRAWLKWARSSGQAFPFRFVATDADTAYDVFLEAPGWGGKNIEPDPALSSGGSYGIELVFRTEDGSAFDTSWSLRAS